MLLVELGHGLLGLGSSDNDGLGGLVVIILLVVLLLILLVLLFLLFLLSLLFSDLLSLLLGSLLLLLLLDGLLDSAGITDNDDLLADGDVILVVFFLLLLSVLSVLSVLLLLGLLSLGLEGSLRLLLLEELADAEALGVAERARLRVERGRGVVARVLLGGPLVLSVKKHGGSVLDLDIAAELVHDRGVGVDGNIDVAELDLTVDHSAGRRKLGPLVGESVAAVASRAHESDNPDVLLVIDNSLLEHVGRERQVVLPDGLGDSGGLLDLNNFLDDFLDDFLDGLFNHLDDLLGGLLDVKSDERASSSSVRAGTASDGTRSQGASSSGASSQGSLSERAGAASAGAGALSHGALSDGASLLAHGSLDARTSRPSAETLGGTTSSDLRSGGSTLVTLDGSRTGSGTLASPTLGRSDSSGGGSSEDEFHFLYFVH